MSGWLHNANGIYNSIVEVFEKIMSESYLINQKNINLKEEIQGEGMNYIQKLLNSINDELSVFSELLNTILFNPLVIDSKKFYHIISEYKERRYRRRKTFCFKSLYNLFYSNIKDKHANETTIFLVTLDTLKDIEIELNNPRNIRMNINYIFETLDHYLSCFKLTLLTSYFFNCKYFEFILDKIKDDDNMDSYEWISNQKKKINEIETLAELLKIDILSANNIKPIDKDYVEYIIDNIRKISEYFENIYSTTPNFSDKQDIQTEYQDDQEDQEKQENQETQQDNQDIQMSSEYKIFSGQYLSTEELQPLQPSQPLSYCFNTVICCKNCGFNQMYQFNIPT